MFKTRGFVLNQPIFLEPERLSQLLAPNSIKALCWAVRTGEWLHQHHLSTLKPWTAKVFFIYRLDYLRSIVIDLDLKHARNFYTL